ncbi:MAG: SPOR domain-containing protein [Phycisphaerales bacterium]|nr:SPOR domain-containing protein [Phycisphaerales bacterium]
MPSRTTAAALLAAFLLAGCAAKPKGPTAAESYQAGDFARAYELASAEAARSTGPARERAALLAGMSAHARDDNTSAEAQLRPLLSSRDPDTAGMAGLTLGLVEAEQNNHREAVVLFSSAAPRLRGEQAARAYFYAGESHNALGNSPTAVVQYRLAQARATSPTLQAIIANRLAMDAFTLQLGAFRDPNRAQSLAAQNRRRAAAMGLPEPRVMQRPDPSGRAIYLVHIGLYRTQQEAAAARAAMGNAGAVVRTSSSPG